MALDIGLKQVNKQSQQDVDSALQDAAVAKASGCLLSILGKPKDVGVMRGLVRAEILQFRGKVGKEHEKELLHPLLWERTQQVLSGVA